MHFCYFKPPICDDLLWLSSAVLYYLPLTESKFSLYETNMYGNYSIYNFRQVDSLLWATVLKPKSQGWWSVIWNASKSKIFSVLHENSTLFCVDLSGNEVQKRGYIYVCVCVCVCTHTQLIRFAIQQKLNIVMQTNSNKNIFGLFKS